jgi:anti-sigma factor RsiW
MKIQREVILDLLPLYASGEASTATRSLVEDYLSHDPKLTKELQRLQTEDLFALPVLQVPPELAMESLRRTKALLARQRWLSSFGWLFTVLAFSSQMNVGRGGISGFHLLLQTSPAVFGSFLIIGLSCWTVYFAIRRRLSSGVTQHRGKPRHS